MAYELIKQFEGYRDTAYQCDAGVWTIGWGSTTYTDGTKVKEGDKITQSRAEEMLDAYYKKWVKPTVDQAGLPFHASQALGSLIFNIGVQQLGISDLGRAIKAKEYGRIIQSWAYTRAGGKTNLGLARRRAAELVEFFKDFR
jgi:lysozyme